MTHADGIERVSVDEARRKAERGEALLVCAYDDEEKCNRIRLDGSISLARLREMERTLPRDRELIFYCA